MKTGAHSMTYTFTRLVSSGEDSQEEEITIEVNYDITDYFPATYYEPAEGAEVEVGAITREDGKPVALTDEEMEKLETYITENHEFGDDDGDREYDSRRDE